MTLVYMTVSIHLSLRLTAIGNSENPLLGMSVSYGGANLVLRFEGFGSEALLMFAKKRSPLVARTESPDEPTSALKQETYT